MSEAAKTVLLTGAAGFLGRHALHRLLSLGHQVIAVTRREVDWPRLIGESLGGSQRNALPNPDRESDRFRAVHCDLTDERAVRDVVESVAPDWIWHLAGYAEGLPGAEHLLPSFHGDLRTTVNLLAASIGVVRERIVITGSLEEPDSFPASSPYAVAKQAGVQYARACRDLYDLPVAVARVFMTYGPGQRERKVIPYAIRCFLAGQAPQLGAGHRRVDWIYVDDVVDGLLACSQQAAALDEPCELGSGHLVSIRDVIATIRALMPGSPEACFDSQPSRGQERERAAQFGTQQRIGWRPQVSLTDGLRRTIAALRD